MKTTLSGIITNIFRAEIRGGFESRKFRLKQSDREKYPQHWELECQQNDCNLLDAFRIGDEVNCDVEIRGREWKKTSTNEVFIFNTLKCVDISIYGSATKPTPSLRQQTGGIAHKEKEAEAPPKAKKEDPAPTTWPGAKNLPEIDF